MSKLINIIQTIIKPSFSKTFSVMVFAILFILAKPNFEAIAPLWLIYIYETIGLIFILAVIYFIVSYFRATIYILFTVDQILEIKQSLEVNRDYDKEVELNQALHAMESNQKILMSIFVLRNKSKMI